MPAPSILVTFKDADGDEFPIRIPGLKERYERHLLIVEARRRLQDFDEAGELKPSYPLDPTCTVEQL